MIGREFDASVVAAVVGCSEDDAVDRLDEVLTARLIDEVEGRFGRFTFAHALVRSTLVDELSTNRRIRLHRQIAEALVARPGSTNAELADHFCEAATAGVAEQAVRYSCAAGSEARDRLAFDDAVAIYERALDAIDGMVDEPSPLRAQVLAELALAVGLQLDIPRARRLALEVAELARELGDPVLLANVGLAYQGQLGMWATPGDPIALDLMNEALVGLGDEHEVIRARTGAAIAHGHVLTAGDVGLRSADDAVALAARPVTRAALCSALTARRWSVRGRLPVVERRAAAEELVAAGRTFGLRTYEQAGLYLLGSELLNAADLDGADAVFASSSAGFAGLPSESGAS